MSAAQLTAYFIGVAAIIVILLMWLMESITNDERNRDAE